MSRPAVFLDRDGTLIEERGHLDRIDFLELFPWTPDAIRLLNRAGYAAVVITNQSAIGRGIIDEPFLNAGIPGLQLLDRGADGARLDLNQFLVVGQFAERSGNANVDWHKSQALTADGFWPL